MRPLPFVVALLTLCVTVPGLANDPEYRGEIEAFRAKREAGLRSEGSWLSVVGLHWLKPGETLFGSAAVNGLRLPKASPAHAGRLRLQDGRVLADLEPGAGATVDGHPVRHVELASDRSGAPTILRIGAVTLQVIERGGRLAVRLKDDQSAKRTSFRGLQWFPVDERYRVQARWEPLAPHGFVPIANVTGMVNEMESPGFAVFEWQGRTHRIQAVLEAPTDEQLFFIFKDLTAGRQTYGAGRFLYSTPPKDGKVVLDFNKAYSPPCAFTNFATCPLPPRQNGLSFAVEAGELDPH